MPEYQVLLHGRNVLVELDGRLRKHGFYKAIRVDAPDPDAAAHMAVDTILEEPILGAAANEAADAPILEVDEVAELDAGAPEMAEPGFIWYRERRWWQCWK